MSAPAVKLPSARPRGKPTSAAAPDFMPTLFGLDYSTYGTQPTNFILSFVLHTLGVFAVVIITTYALNHREELKTAAVQIFAPSDLSPYVLPPAKDQAGGGGGGGDRDKLAASKGALPKLSREQFTPPAVVIRNPDPKLPMEPTVVVPPDIKLPQTGQLGDPMSSVLGPASNGTGSGGGIGSGSGGGVGSGRGPGVGPGWGGGIGDGPYRVGGGVSAPRALYAPDPEYSEEARKAKYQGTVVLWVVVGPDGKPRDIRVQRSLGLGLDEKAVEAVRQWKFEPAKMNGNPVAVQINVEVNFRLY